MPFPHIRMCIIRMLGAPRLAIVTALVFSGIGGSLRSEAQTSAPASGHADALNIVFLHQVQKYANADPNTAVRFAARLGVTPAELKTLFSTARGFISADYELMMEQRAYREHQNSLRKPLDLPTIKHFTARRYTLARSAISSLQNNLSPASYAAVQHFLTNEFPKSVVFWR